MTRICIILVALFLVGSCVFGDLMDGTEERADSRDARLDNIMAEIHSGRMPATAAGRGETGR